MGKAEKQRRTLIISMAWPVMLEMASLTVTQVVDMMMVGRLGPVAIAAVGLSNIPIQYTIQLFNALSVGTTALVSRAVGGGKTQEGREILQQSFFLSAAAAISMGLVFLRWAPAILGFFGPEAGVLELGSGYMRLMVPGFIAMFISLVIAAGLRGAGDTRTPMKINLGVNMLNVLGNYLLIFGPGPFPAMGVAGAGLATSLSRTIGAGFLVYLIIYKHPLLRMQGLGLKLRFDLIGKVLDIGLPASGEQLVMRLGQLFYERMVASLGTAAYAAHQVALKAEAFSYMPGFGLAVATATVVGKNLGAGQPEEASAGAHESWKMGLVIMGSMGLIFFFFPHNLMRLFVDDPEIIELGAGCLRIVAFAQLPMATHFIYSWGLRGAGETKSVFYSTAVATWGGRLLFGYIFIRIFELGLYGAWLAMIVDWLLRGTYVRLRFNRGHWKKIQI